MKKADIRVGGHYRAKVFGVETVVRVDSIREEALGTKPYWKVTNLTTGRKITWWSAAKFRSEVDPEPRPFSGGSAKVAPTARSVTVTETAEGEQRPDPTPAPVAGPSAAAERALTPATATERSTTTSGLSTKLSALARPTDNAPHLIVEARAGTGKTTTLIEGLKVLRGIGSTLTPSPQQRAVWDSMALSRDARTVCFVAFNRSIADELKRRVPAGCDAMTMHGLGCRAVNAAFRPMKLQVNEYRTGDIIAELLGRDKRDLRREKPTVLAATERLVGLCKMNLTDAADPANLDALASHYEVELEDDRGRDYRDEVYALVPRVLERAKDVGKDRQMDFDDMIWLPIALDLPVTRYDLLLVDEAQDLNRCQQSLAKRAGSRLILCGDPRQAIYGFAGADADSMPRMARELSGDPGNIARRKYLTDGRQNGEYLERCYAEEIDRLTNSIGRGCVTLPLTVTRRCGKAIVREANKIVPDFEAFETNPEGTIRLAAFVQWVGEPDDPINTRTFGTPNEDYARLVREGDMVLCRVNAPLVSQCFRFIRAGRKANIQGRDVGKGLITTINKLSRDGTDSVAAFVAALGDWLEGEQRKETAKKNPSESRLIGLQDRHDCLMCFTEGLRAEAPASEIAAKVQSIFTDDKTAPGIRLSSIHKAKGLEAHRVFLLEPEGATVPHPMAKSAWQMEQEWNCRYIALTRAISELVYVS